MHVTDTRDRVDDGLVLEDGIEMDGFEQDGCCGRTGRRCVYSSLASLSFVACCSSAARGVHRELLGDLVEFALEIEVDTVYVNAEEVVRLVFRRRTPPGTAR